MPSSDCRTFSPVRKRRSLSSDYRGTAMLNRRKDWSPVLHISKSHLATYLQCPRRFWFQYVVGQPWEFVPAAVAFGKAIHEAVAFFYEQLALGPTKPPQDAVQTRFRQRWRQA